MWNPVEKSMMDMLYVLKPDIVFYDDEKYNLGGDIFFAKDRYPNSIFIKASELDIQESTNVSCMYGGQPHPKFECELLVFTDNYKPVKILEIIEQFETAKIFGKKILPVPNYVGGIRYEDYPSVISSAKYQLCFNDEERLNAQLNMVAPILHTNPQKKEITHQEKQENFQEAVSNTYFHQAAKILKSINKIEEAEHCLQTLSNALKKFQKEI
jgi:hypothetical protein